MDTRLKSYGDPGDGSCPILDSAVDFAYESMQSSVYVLPGAPDSGHLSCLELIKVWYR